MVTRMENAHDASLYCLKRRRMEEEQPIYCDIVRDDPTQPCMAKTCMMDPLGKCLYSQTALGGMVKHGQPHLRVSLAPPHERRNRADSFAHLSCVHVVCVGPHLPKAAKRAAYFPDAERRNLFMSFPGMDKLDNDEERKALCIFWSALVEANLIDKHDTLDERLTFPSYPVVKALDGCTDIDDVRLSAILKEQQAELEEEEEEEEEEMM